MSYITTTTTPIPAAGTPTVYFNFSDTGRY
jgi:hypothetical protein